MTRARRTVSGEPGSERLGPLLHVLARSVGRGRVGAAGLGAATEAAWLAAALPPGVPLVVVDDTRADGLAAALGADPDVRVSAGGLAELDANGPYDLLVLGPGVRDAPPDAALRLLAPHGLAVVAAVSEGWRRHPELVFAELGDGVLLVARR